MASKTERFEMRMDEDILERIDRWRASQDDVPSRAEATRRLIELGLARAAGNNVQFSDGERLLALMMRDVYKRLNVEGEIDADFVAEVIWGGHFWAPKWVMTGVFHGEEDDPRNVSFVAEVLNMWSFLERAYGRMDEKAKERIAVEAKPFGTDVRFDGFDGNNEGELLGIADFLINKMGRFAEFRKRDLNSHFPTVDMYKRMLAVFAPMQKSLFGRDLGTNEVIRVLKARVWRAEPADQEPEQ